MKSTLLISIWCALCALPIPAWTFEPEDKTESAYESGPTLLETVEQSDIMGFFAAGAAGFSATGTGGAEQSILIITQGQAEGGGITSPGAGESGLSQTTQTLADIFSQDDQAHGHGHGHGFGQ